MMLISVFTVTKLRKVIVLFGGLTLLVNMALTLAFMGWFFGTDMVLALAVVILCGGLLFQKIPQASSCFFRSLMVAWGSAAQPANNQSVFQRLGKHGRHSKSLEGSSTRSCYVL